MQSINAPKKTLRISDVYIQLKYIMRGYKIKFFLGENQTEDNNNVVRRAKKMGAIIVTNSEETPKLGKAYPIKLSEPTTWWSKLEPSLQSKT